MSTKSFWQTIKKPIIGVAPMDGYTDSPFRRVCKRVNPDIITFTEFTSADGLHYKAEKLKHKLSFHPDEQPVIAQIFGKSTDTFITAAKLCEDMGFSGIDLNMGCPSKRVVRSEHGVALRRNKDLAFKLVESVAQNTSLPVSVKTRLGWSNAEDLIEFGQGVQNAGANMICIHARTYQEPYKVAPQYAPVYELKESVTIPVLGNGGICSLEDGMNRLHNLDGFLIGQATFGNPWIFTKTPPKTFGEKIPLILNHSRWLIDYKGNEVGCREIRKHLLSYIKNFRQAKLFRSKIVHVNCLDDIEESLNHINHFLENQDNAESLAT